MSYNPYCHNPFGRYKNRRSYFDKVEEDIKQSIFRSPNSFTQKLSEKRKIEMNQRTTNYSSSPKGLNREMQLVSYTNSPKIENKRSEFRKSTDAPKPIQRKDECTPQNWKSGKLFHSDEFNIDLTFVSLTADDLIIGYSPKTSTIHWCNKHKIHDIIE